MHGINAYLHDSRAEMQVVTLPLIMKSLKRMIIIDLPLCILDQRHKFHKN